MHVASSTSRASQCSGTTTGSRIAPVASRGGARRPVKGGGGGIAGGRGFVGGFGQQWANFGEPIFREAYAETTRDVEGLERGLAAIEPCAVRIALLHYSPVEATLVG